MTTGSRTRPQSGNRRGGGGPGGGAFGRRRRGRNVLKAEEIDYKDVQLMRRFVSERGKIVSGQRIGVTAKNQRRLARAIKRAQHLALIPMAPDHVYVTGAIQTDAPRPQESEAVGEESAVEASEQQEAVVSQTEETSQTAETAVENSEETPSEPEVAEPTSEADSSVDETSDD